MKASIVAILLLIFFSLFSTPDVVDASEIQASLLGWQGDGGALRYRAAPGSEFNVLSQNQVNLSAGAILVEAMGSGMVSSPVAEIYVSGKSIVLFVARQGSIRCQVLWDAGSGSVAVVSNKHHAKLGSGDEALVTDHDPEYQEIMMSDDIGRRRIKTSALGGGKFITTAEFSLLHALERDPLLYDVFRSGNPHDKEIKERILKTAAVLNMVTTGHGYYSSGGKF